MPAMTLKTTIEALRRLAVTTLAYAFAVAILATLLPTILTPLPAAAFLPEPPPVVARVPAVTPPTEPAP